MHNRLPAIDERHMTRAAISRADLRRSLQGSYTDPTVVRLNAEGMTVEAVRAVSDMRRKNQVTVPHRIAELMGLRPGTRLIFDLDPDDPDVVHVRRLRESYAGVARGIYGATEEEVDEYLRGERASWEE
jgi:bifunctional DNA-binding transcriptional regulator/antitoxin component of YhaV-PrlF toxin-antitoxin module